jgi:hypothetical protein
MKVAHYIIRAITIYCLLGINPIFGQFQPSAGSQANISESQNPGEPVFVLPPAQTITLIDPPDTLYTDSTYYLTYSLSTTFDSLSLKPFNNNADPDGALMNTCCERDTLYWVEGYLEGVTTYSDTARIVIIDTLGRNVAFRYTVNFSNNADTTYNNLSYNGFQTLGDSVLLVPDNGSTSDSVYLYFLKQAEDVMTGQPEISGFHALSQSFSRTKDNQSNDSLQWVLTGPGIPPLDSFELDIVLSNTSFGGDSAHVNVNSDKLKYNGIINNTTIRSARVYSDANGELNFITTQPSYANPSVYNQLGVGGFRIRLAGNYTGTEQTLPDSLWDGSATIVENTPSHYVGRFKVGTEPMWLPEDIDDNIYFEIRGGDSVYTVTALNYEAFRGSNFATSQPTITAVDTLGDTHTVTLEVLENDSIDGNGFVTAQEAGYFKRQWGDSSIIAGDYLICDNSNGSLEVILTGESFAGLQYPNQIKIMGLHNKMSLFLDTISGNNTKEPIIITNFGGLAIVMDGITFNGFNAIRLTGQYDPDKRTGHPDFAATIHDEFKHRQMGVIKFSTDINNTYGIEPKGEGMSRFEMDHVEMYGTNYTCMNFKDDGAGGGYVDSSFIHDCYCHDQKGEGFYKGNTKSIATHGPQQFFRYDEVSNNIIVRTTNEAIQTNRNTAENIVSNNVLLGGGNIINPFQFNQSGVTQVAPAGGRYVDENNIAMSAGTNTLNHKARVGEDRNYGFDNDRYSAYENRDSVFVINNLYAYSGRQNTLAYFNNADVTFADSNTYGYPGLYMNNVYTVWNYMNKQRGATRFQDTTRWDNYAAWWGIAPYGAGGEGQAATDPWETTTYRRAINGTGYGVGLKFDTIYYDETVNAVHTEELNGADEFENAVGIQDTTLPEPDFENWLGEWEDSAVWKETFYRWFNWQYATTNFSDNDIGEIPTFRAANIYPQAYEDTLKYLYTVGAASAGQIDFAFTGDFSGMNSITVNCGVPAFESLPDSDDSLKALKPGDLIRVSHGDRDPWSNENGVQDKVWQYVVQSVTACGSTFTINIESTDAGKAGSLNTGDEVRIIIYNRPVVNGEPDNSVWYDHYENPYYRGDVVLHFVPRDYKFSEVTSYQPKLYFCKQSHSSRMIYEPGVGSNWREKWEEMRFWNAEKRRYEYYPPDDYDLTTGSYYKQLGIGLE